MTSTLRRFGIRLFVALAVCLALDGAAAAATKRCATVQRRAQAKLESALAKCVDRQASAEIAQCSTARWTQYVRRLRRTRCPVGPESAVAARPGHPLLAIVRAEGVSADDLAAADVAARGAHLAVRRVLRRFAATVEAVRAGQRPESSLGRFAGEIQAAVDALVAAEQRLADVEDALWHGMRGNPSLAWLVHEPLRVAMEQVQVEVRRLLGPEFRTEIAALRAEPGCAGDLVGDRLLAAYGRAVLSPEDDEAEIAALGRVAAQLACLSARQARLVDLAVGVAWDMVAVRLERAGLARVRGPFARWFAPLQVLILDTVKHAGEKAHAWHWFRDLHPVLRDEVERLGWPTGDVLWLYDRMDGKLVGFVPCRNGDVARCVDLPAFLDSLTDPRALGYGDCALAGMVAGGVRQAAGATRYACPSADCDAGASAPGGRTAGGALDRLLGRRGPSSKGGTGRSTGDLPWTGLTAADHEAMADLGCAGDIGGGGGGGSEGDDDGTQGRGGHGDAGATSDCVEQAIRAPRDPWGAYVQCIADVAEEAEGALVSLGGVPTGPECTPSVANGGSTGTTAPPSSGATTTTVAASDPTTTTAPSANPPCVPSGILDAITKVIDCGLPVLGLALSSNTPKTSTPASGPAAAAGAVVAAEVALLTPDNAKNAYDFAGANLMRQIELECTGDGKLSPAECSVLQDMKPGDAAEYLRNKGLIQDCAPDQECEAVCTGLDEQVRQRMDDCQRTLDERLRGDAPTQHDLDSRIQPTPDDEGAGGLPDDPLTSCLLASAPADGGGMDLACGLVLCADGPSSAHTTSACCGLGTPAIGVSAGRLLLERTCDRVQCGEGESAVADGLGACGCGGAVGGIGGETPVPSPAPDPRGR